MNTKDGLEYIPKELINSLNKDKHPKLIEYCQIINEQIWNDKIENKYENTAQTIDERILREMQQIENEKLKNIRQEANLIDSTKEVMETINEYIKNNKTLIITSGLPGSGKSHFVKKHFPENNVNMDDELNKLAYLYEKATEADIITGRLENYINNQIEKEIGKKLKKESIIIDSVNSTKKERQEKYKQYNKNDYQYNERICFLFDSESQTCYERMQTRKKDPPTQIHHLSSLIYFLLRFESPLKNDLTPEGGLDLILTIDTKGDVKSAHPIETYNKIKSTTN